MKNKDSKRLVIDASVAQASGTQSASDPRSIHCRDFLESVRQICHQVVMTPDIRDEWNRHQSRFARAWRLSMIARRKVFLIGSNRDDELRSKIIQGSDSEKERDTMLKDIHLIEAALATDKIIVSLDSNSQTLFQLAAWKMGALRSIAWVNPETDQAWSTWLETGADPQKRKLLDT